MHEKSTHRRHAVEGHEFPIPRRLCMYTYRCSVRTSHLFGDKGSDVLTQSLGNALSGLTD